MIGISSKTFYAIAALQELGELEEGKVLKIKEIATQASIPQNFLEQILLELKKQGLLKSLKGAYGGYKLAKSLKEITLKEVVLILESDIFSQDYQTQDEGLILFWDALRTEMEKVFETPLSELANYQQKVNQTLNFSI
jgi:Rrf2 family protein